MYCTVEADFTSNVEEAGEEAVPEGTHLVPHTLMYLDGLCIKYNMLLLADCEHRPALPAVHHAFVVKIWIPEKQNLYKEKCNFFFF